MSERRQRPSTEGGADVTVRLLGGAVMAVAAAQLAVLECFLLPLRIGSTPVPISIPIAMLANVGLPALAYRLTASRAAAALPVMVWIVVVILASVPRPEGDVIVTGTWRGVGLLILGAVAGAYAVGRLLARSSASDGRRPARAAADSYVAMR